MFLSIKQHLRFLFIKVFYFLLEWPQNLLVQLLLNRCCACWLFPQVSAYGFITENYKDFSDHYYDKVMKPLVLYANHDMEMEGRLWKQLHSQKVLWLYQRQKKDMMSLQWILGHLKKKKYQDCITKLPKQYFVLVHPDSPAFFIGNIIKNVIFNKLNKWFNSKCYLEN